MIFRRGIFLAIVLTVASFGTLAFESDEHTVDPFYAQGDISCSSWGYVNVIGSAKDDFFASQIRARIGCKKGGWSFLVEGDLAGLDSRIPNPNYLVQGWVAYNFGDEPLFGEMFKNTTLKIGRFLTAAGSTNPAMYMLVPIERIESGLFGIFGTGIQIKTRITDEVSFTADITGSTGRPFNSSESYDRVEFSQRLEWKREFSSEKSLEAAVFSQWSSDFERYGLDFTWTWERLEISGGLFGVNEHAFGTPKKNLYGGDIMGDILLYKHPKLHIRAHGIADFMKGDDEYFGNTIGLQAFLPKTGGYGRFANSSITIDGTHSQSREGGGPLIKDDSIMIRFRIFF